MQNKSHNNSSCHICHHRIHYFCYCYHIGEVQLLSAAVLLEITITVFCANPHGELVTRIGNYLGNVDILLLPVHPSEDLHQARYSHFVPLVGGDISKPLNEGECAAGVFDICTLPSNKSSLSCMVCGKDYHIQCLGIGPTDPTDFRCGCHIKRPLQMTWYVNKHQFVKILFYNWNFSLYSHYRT